MHPARFLDLCNVMGPLELARMFGLSRMTMHRYRVEAQRILDGLPVPPFRLPRAIVFTVPCNNPAIVVEHTEESVAAKIVADLGTQLLYDTRLKCWYIFKEGAHVYIRETGGNAPSARALVRHTLATASHAQGSVDITRAVAIMMDILSNSPVLSDAAQKIDTNFSRVAFTNGVYDSKTHEFRPGRPEDLLCKACLHEYVPYSEISLAKRESLERFLARIYADPTEFVQAATNRLFGGTKEIWLLCGESNTGKSTIVNLLRAAFGPMVCSVPQSVLTKLKPIAPTSPSDFLVPMVGCRFACLNELDRGARINASVAKQLSGGDLISFRASRGVQISFTFGGTLVMTTNFMPEFSQDLALQKRIRLFAHNRELPVSGAGGQVGALAPAFVSLLIHALGQGK